MDELVGKIFAEKYKVIEVLGEGATARVYLAYDQVNEMNVSLKILKNYNIDEKKIRNFKREAKAISLLDHKNIIQIYEIDEWNGYHYISQEFVDGISLKEFIKTTKKILVSDVVDISKQILQGLANAHENKVIHKDIKSQNILYNINKEVKITDFGIADILEEEATRTQTLMGTPQYVAPEILSKHISSEQSDIYAVGIVMYELLMGAAPFVGEKPTIIMMKQLNQPLPSIVKERNDVPQSLENVIIKATAKKTKNRHQNVQEMLDDLNTCLSISRRNEDKLHLFNDFSNSDDTMNLTEVQNMQKQEEKDSKRKKQMLIITCILAVLALIIGGTVWAIRGGVTVHVMPVVRNMNVDTARDLLIGENIAPDKIKIEYKQDNEIAEDMVIETNPKAGEEIRKDDIITLIVSKGQEDIDIKNYIGESSSTAKQELEGLKFIVDIKYEYAKEESGIVIGQDPKEGKLAFGSIITLTVSKGQKEIKVDNFKGKTKAEVQAWVDENKVKVQFTEVCSSEAKDVVLDQKTPYDTIIKEGYTIKVDISSGKACEPDPTNDDDGTTPEDPNKNN